MNRGQYAGFHLLRVFFEDLTVWRCTAPLASIPSTLTQQEYDDLFKGTRADVYVPLWASACLSGMDILLNEITLEAIITYKKYGYAPVRMDGNPPDYIGEQFRFLEYLSRCALRGDGEAARAAEDFIDNFTLDTVRVMAKSLRAQTESPEVLAMLALADSCLTGGGPDLPDETLATFDSWTWTRNSPLPVEEARVVSQASFNDCGNKCKMLSTVREGCVLSITPDKNTDFQFAGCPRGAAYRATFLSSHRLRYPMERVGKRGEGRFRRISWDKAVEKVSSAIVKSRRDGPGSRYVLSGAGIRSILQGSMLTKRLLAADGGYLSYYSTYSIGGALPVLPRMFGQLEIANHESEILNAKLLILWGNNLVTNHFGTAQKRLLMQAKDQGAHIIVIDPRQSDTALAAADEWVPIRPSTDSALADAMCWVIREKGLVDQRFIDNFCLGMDDAHLPEGVPAGESYFAYLSGERDGVAKTPAWAEAITGVPAETIERLATEYAQARWGCILLGLGPQRTLNGEQNYRSILALACLTGGLGQPGGGVITWRRPAPAQPETPLLPNPYPAAIPAFQWWRAVECPETLDASRGLTGVDSLDGPVHLLFSIASGMLLNQHSDINHTLRLLQREDLIETLVLSDVFMTPSARAADLLLPAPSFFETDNISPPWGGENYMLYNHAAIAPLFGARLELDWLIEVARRIGVEDAFCDGAYTLEDWLRRCWDAYRALTPTAPDFDTVKRESLVVSPTGHKPVTFWDNIHGGKPFGTPSGKIEIFSPELYEKKLPGVPAIPGYLPVEEGVGDPLRGTYPLQLIGYHSKRRCHSIHDQNPWLEELETPKVWLHPDDARARGIQDGELVEVFNARGRVRIPAYVTPRIMLGVCALATGGWFTPDEKGIDTRGSINVLTMSHRATPLGHANPQHTNLVQVERAR